MFLQKSVLYVNSFMKGTFSSLSMVGLKYRIVTKGYRIRDCTVWMMGFIESHNSTPYVHTGYSDVKRYFAQ